MADDFYLNLVDWGSTNVLAVGLGSCVYLWSACTSRVMKLCEIGPYDSVASVNWIQRVISFFLFLGVPFGCRNQSRVSSNLGYCQI